MALPKGTVYIKYSEDEPFSMNIEIKEGNCGDNDFFATRLYDTHYDEDADGNTCFFLDFEGYTRDGWHHENQMFSVFDLDELRALIQRLSEALTEQSK